MPRTFASASSEKIDLAIGAGASITGALTFALIVKSASDGGTRTFLWIGDGTNFRAIDINTTDNFRLRSGGTNAGPLTVKVADGWTLIAVTKASGTATPRFHKYVYGTNTWTHQDDDATSGDNTPGGTASAIAARTANTNHWNGDIAIGGAWAAALTDAQIEALAYSLPAWFAVQPNGLWILDQATTAQKVVDLTGNGANESAITGTTVSTGAVPVFSYGASVAVRELTRTGGRVVSAPKYTKPPPGVQIDWGHPLALGLQAAFTLSEGTGPSLNNAVGGVATGSTAQGWRATGFGTLTSDTSSDTAYRTTQPSFPYWSNAASVTVRFDYKGGGATDVYQSILARGSVFENDTMFTVGVRPLNGDNKIFAYSYVGATLKGNEWSSGALVSLGPTTITAVWEQDGSTLNVYKNGVLWQTQSAAPLGGNGGQGLSIASPNTYNTTSRNFAGVVHYAFVHRRALSAKDVQTLYAEPYAFLAPQSPKRLYFPLSSGPTTHNATLTVAGAGAVAATGLRTASASATVAGDGALAFTGLRTALATLPITGDGALAFTELRAANANLTVAGSGALAFTGVGSQAAVPGRTITYRENTTARHREQTSARYREN